MSETAQSGVLIRAVAAADIAAVARIYAFAVKHGTATFEIDPPDEAEMARRHAALADQGYPYLVAERSGSIAGYAYAGTYRARPAYRWSVEDSIYIAPEFFRQGIGSALLMQLIAEAEARGFRQMIAVIGDSAQLPSIAVHAKAGFAHIGTLRAVGFKHGRWLDTVLMQRALAPALWRRRSLRPRPAVSNDRAPRAPGRVPAPAAK